MALTNDQIKALLAKPERNKGGGKGKGGKLIDTSNRDYTTWFALAHRIFDEEKDFLSCENPKCVDPRPKVEGKPTVVAEIDGVLMCRYCFFEGYGLFNPEQEQIVYESSDT